MRKSFFAIHLPFRFALGTIVAGDHRALRVFSHINLTFDVMKGSVAELPSLMQEIKGLKRVYKNLSGGPVAFVKF